jgi:hypothetical protein
MGEPESESAGTHGQQGASMPVARGNDRIADRRDNAAEERDRIADAREHRPTTGSGTSTPGRSCWPNAGRNARQAPTISSTAASNPSSAPGKPCTGPWRDWTEPRQPLHASEQVTGREQDEINRETTHSRHQQELE